MKPQNAVFLLLLLLSIVGCRETRQSDSPHTRESSSEVVITDAGERQIEAIKAVREVTGLGLADAKRLVDRPQSVVLSNISDEEAEAAAARLREAGMKIELREE